MNGTPGAYCWPPRQRARWQVGVLEDLWQVLWWWPAGLTGQYSAEAVRQHGDSLSDPCSPVNGCRRSR